MVKKIDPLTKFLIPIGGKHTYQSACKLAGFMASLLPKRLESVAVVHVIEGSYLSTHMENVDVRVRHIVESESFKKLKQQHIDKDIRPILDEAVSIIHSMAPGIRVEERILEGSPAKEIVDLVKKEGFSTIFIQRRTLDPALAGPILGSVSSGIIHARIPVSIYVPGTAIDESGSFKLERCIIPVDGSDGSKAAIREAADLINGVDNGAMCEVYLLYVLNLADLPDEFDTTWLKQEGGRILEDAEKYLKEHLSRTIKIEQVKGYGHPAEVIMNEADERGADIIFIGRRGKNALEEIIVGSVGRELLSRVLRPTLAIINE